MKKSFYALFLMLVVILSFAGCNKVQNNSSAFETNAFRLARTCDENGKITVTYSFPVNSARFKELGYNDEQIKNYKFYLVMLVNALAQQNKQKIADGVAVSNCIYFENLDSVGFSIIFSDLQAQKDFYSSGEENSSSENSSSVKTSGFFMKKVELTTVFPFSATSAQDVKKVCEIAIASWQNDNKITDENVAKILDNSLFIYEYATTDGKLKSNNYFYDEKYHYNVFVKSFEELKTDTNITFYYSVPNTPIWYLLALVLVVFGMAAAYFIKIRQKNKEK